MDMLYTKSLRISSAARAAVGVGAIVNLQSNDASKLWNLPQYGHMLWSGPFQARFWLEPCQDTCMTWPSFMTCAACKIDVLPC